MKQLEENISREELIELAAVDSEFYCRTFFPQTARIVFAPAHSDAWKKLESNNRLVNILMGRGFGKTSQSRLYTSKSIAYGLSNTIAYVSKSEGHAVKSTSWIKKAVEYNTLWNTTFSVRKGEKWQDTEFEIIVGPKGEEKSIWVMAAGILGSIRGVNRDDYRPDLIVLDDILDDENAHTAEQRQKVENLVYGALYESLAPESEAAHAKMIALNTPQHREDFAVKALRDPAWLSAVHGCFTKETMNLPLQYQESAWPERWSSETLRKEKSSAIARNMLSVFLRERECKLVSAETSSFKLPWLKKYDTLPPVYTSVYAIDPVPPPSERELAKGLKDKDYEAHVVWGAYEDKRFLLHYELMRGHEPTWTVMKFFEIQRKFRPIKCLVESVQYQRTLAWLLKKAMDQARVWYAISEYTDKRGKFNRIVSGLNGIASSGRMYVKNEHTEFLEQFGTYPDVSHDDLLDASSMCLDELEGLFIESDGSVHSQVDLPEQNIPELNIWAAP